jgi:hypothetical protein
LYTRHGELKTQLDAAVNDWEAASMELEEAKG